jgi:hypothetical protein
MSEQSPLAINSGNGVDRMCVSLVPRNEAARAGEGGTRLAAWLGSGNHVDRAKIAERVLRLADRGGKHSNPQDRSPNEQDAHQPAAPAHARRHERRFASDTQAIVANDPRGFERIRVALEPRQRSSLASPKRRGLARSGFDLVEANGRARTRGNRDARGKHRLGRETPRLPLIAGRG